MTIREAKGPGSAPIRRIELTPIFVPFRPEMRELMESAESGPASAIGAEEPRAGGDFVICRMIAEDGSAGLGEAFLWLPDSGAIPDQLVSVIEKALGRFFIGESPYDVARIRVRMDLSVARNEIAKGLLDMACYDLAGRMSDRPVCEMLGGSGDKELSLCAVLPLTDHRRMAELGRSYAEEGFRSLRCRLGAGVTEDVSTIIAVREAVGDDVRLRVDYNQAYSEEEATSAIRAVDPFDIEVAEQPVAAGDFAGMSRVQQEVNIPLMAHQGCFSLADIYTLSSLGSIGVVGISAERPGGITDALRAIELAREEEMGVVIHNRSLGISQAAQAHVATARRNLLGHDPELFGQVVFEDDLLSEGMDYSGGGVRLPDGPGFGVDLDPDALDRYSTGPTAVIED